MLRSLSRPLRPSMQGVLSCSHLANFTQSHSCPLAPPLTSHSCADTSSRSLQPSHPLRPRPLAPPNLRCWRREKQSEMNKSDSVTCPPSKHQASLQRLCFTDPCIGCVGVSRVPIIRGYKGESPGSVSNYMQYIGVVR